MMTYAELADYIGKLEENQRQLPVMVQVSYDGSFFPLQTPKRGPVKIADEDEAEFEERIAVGHPYLVI